MVEVANALIEKTRKGRVQDWIERMSEIVTAAGLDTSQINWQGAPKGVALGIAMYVHGRGQTDETRLIIAIEQYIEE